MAGNQLISLDVSQNSALTDLYCDNNYFTEVDVSNLNLKGLYTDGTIDSERKVLLVNPQSDVPEVTPDKTISVGEKVTFKATKKAASVEGFDPES